MKAFSRLAVLAGLASIGGGAQAQSSCEFVFDSLASSPSSYEFFKENHPECFPSDSAATVSQQALSATTAQQVFSVSNAVAARFTGAAPAGQLASIGSGMAAGNSGKVFAWANAGINKTIYNANALSSDTDITSGTFGADYAIRPNMVVGLSLAFDGGSGIINGTAFTASLDTSSKTLAPYFGWQITPELTLDASAGLGRGKQEQSGSSVDSDRTFAAANLTFTRWYNNFQLGAKGSYLHAEEDFDNIKVGGTSIANSSTKNRLDQIRLGGQLAYWMQGGIMPYVGLAYANDISRTSAPNQPWDDDAFVLTLGANATSLKDGITAGIAYNNELGRSNSHNHTLNFSLNLRF